MKHKKKAICLIAALFALMLAACGQNGTAGLDTDPGTDQNQGQTAEPEVTVKEATGTFTGLADPHTVEIILDSGEAAAFQFDESLSSSIADIQENDTVSLKYEEKSIPGEDTLKQRILVEITKTGTASGGTNEDDAQKDRPDTKELTLTIEGMTETKEAGLISARDGYSLYVFDIFTFNPETGSLTMDVDPNYVVQVEKLPNDVTLEDVRQEGITSLSEYGTIEEVTEDNRPEEMKEVSLFLTAKEAANGTTHEYIVREVDGTLFAFQLTIPEGEPSEGFVPHVYASLNTIEPKVQ